MFKKSCCKAKELSVSFQRVSNIQLYIYIFNLHLIDGHVYTHIYKIDDTEKKREGVKIEDSWKNFVSKRKHC